MKYIYLDQKIWIEVAKDILHGTTIPKRKTLLEKINSQISNNEWVFPLSMVHQIETSKRLDDRTRKELSKVMGEFSKNYTISPYIEYKSEEFIMSLLSFHGVISKPLPLRSKIIKQDYANAFGISFDDIEVTSEFLSESQKEELKNDFIRFTKTQNLFPIYADYFSSKNFADDINNEQQFYAKALEDARDELHEMVPDKHKEYRYQIFLAKRFFEMFNDELKLLYDYANKKSIDLKCIFPDNIFSTYQSTIDFLQKAPSFHVYTTLLYEILNSKDRKLSGNDYLDVSFLSTAIPYCDVVITEKSWTGISKKYGLGSLYNTRIFSQVDDLLLI